MDDNTPIFVAGKRTPFAKAFKGSYKDIRPDDLLVELLRNQVEMGKVEGLSPEDVLIGCAYPEGEQGYNMARMVALGCGLEAPGTTVNRLCASSLEVVAMAASRIRSGWGDCYLVGGVESMSRIQRGGANFSKSESIEEVAPSAYISMGETAENVASRYEISRAKQEEFAAKSHELAHKAYEENLYDAHILEYIINKDEFIRYPVDHEKVASLKPAFREDGVVTAATSSPLTDGATSGWVISAKKAKELGMTSGLEIVDVTWAHVSPDVMGLGPVPAVQKIFTRNNLKPEDVQAYELNEAFAIQSLACMQDLKLPEEKVNAWGGAMAIGHPLGASGLRLMMTLDHRLRINAENGALGIASLCVGGGQGMAILTKSTI